MKQGTIVNPFRLEFAVHAYSRFYSFKLHIVLAESYMLTAPSEPNQQPFKNYYQLPIGDVNHMTLT